MGIKYELAPDLQNIVNELAMMLFPHVRLNSVVCIRSFGSSSRGTIARCHALGKAMQLALERKGFYVIEVISKRFDKMSEVDKIKTLIHELMHIPKSFGGGFLHHNIVHEGNVNRMYEHYINLKRKDNLGINSFVNDDKNNLKRMDNNQERNEIIIQKKRNWWF